MRILTLTILICAVAVTMPVSMPVPIPVSHATPATYTSHVQYGHAVVAGGIHSLGELLSLYPSMTGAHLVLWPSEINAYVTYAKNGHIYWTHGKKHYPKGELVWTDGTTFVLAKCGNQVRLTLPPHAMTEPIPPSDLNEPLTEVVPNFDTVSTLSSYPLLTLTMPPSEPPSEPEPSTILPFLPPVFLPMPLPMSTPVATPEPAVIYLLFISLVLFMLFPKER